MLTLAGRFGDLLGALQLTHGRLRLELLPFNLVLDVLGHVRHDPGDEPLDAEDEMLENDDEDETGAQLLPEEESVLGDVATLGRVVLTITAE